jgi:hypothetical protein
VVDAQLHDWSSAYAYALSVMMMTILSPFGELGMCVGALFIKSGRYIHISRHVCEHVCFHIPLPPASYPHYGQDIACLDRARSSFLIQLSNGMK